METLRVALPFFRVVLYRRIALTAGAVISVVFMVAVALSSVSTGSMSIGSSGVPASAGGGASWLVAVGDG